MNCQQGGGSAVKQAMVVHVSHKIGNSLCSHPALFKSSFGGIFYYRGI
jgi:hypothetical protein